MFNKKKSPDIKFCPSCGAPLKLADAFCTRCGYSFAHRKESSKKKEIKWIRFIIAIVLLSIMYAGIQYATGNPIIPDFIKNLMPAAK